MKRASIAIAVAVIASVVVSAMSQAAPLAPASAMATFDAVDRVAYMYNGQSYAYRWHGHYYHHRYWRHHRWYYY